MSIEQARIESNLRRGLEGVNRYTDRPNQAALDEVNRDLRIQGTLNDPIARGMVTEPLIRNGLLPRVMIAEFDRLDRDGDRNLTRAELERARDDRNAQPLTRMAATYALENYTAIDQGTTPGQRFGRRASNLYEGLSPSEVATHAEAARRQAEAAARTPEAAQARPQEAARPGEAPRPGARAEANGEPKGEDLLNRVQSTLQSREATVQEKLAALRQLAIAGHREITLQDESGRSVRARIDYAPIQNGNGHYLQLHAIEPGGRQHVILRAVEREGGFRQQTSNGRPVSYVGTWWAQRNPHSNLGAFGERPPVAPATPQDS